MAPKGKSMQEKRQLILDVFHENGEIFDKKAIESMQRRLGINPGKDPLSIITELMSDSLIESEKMSNVNLYWSFPSENYKILKENIAKQLQNIEKLKEDEITINQYLQESLINKEETPEREELLKEITSLNQEYSSLQKDLEIYQKNDPARIEALKKSTIQLQQCTNQWIENQNIAIGYLKKVRFLKKTSELLPIFGLDEDEENLLYPDNV